MSEETASPLLAGGALAAAFAALVLQIVVDAPAARAVHRFVVDRVQWPALVVTAAATSGSLYYSESVGFVPCEFCWFQRVIMYSLLVILAVAVVTRDRIPARYVVALATIGLGLSIYHYQLQLTPEQGSVCSTGVPCTIRYVEQFGFVSIPFMAGCGFLAILLLYLARWRAARFMAPGGEPSAAGRTA
jgi:disulfide bond formation protein DsbB